MKVVALKQTNAPVTHLLAGSLRLMWSGQDPKLSYNGGACDQLGSSFLLVSNVEGLVSEEIAKSFRHEDTWPLPH